VSRSPVPIGRRTVTRLATWTRPRAGSGKSRRVSNASAAGNASTCGYVGGRVSPSGNPHTARYLASRSRSATTSPTTSSAAGSAPVCFVGDGAIAGDARVVHEHVERTELAESANRRYDLGDVHGHGGAADPCGEFAQRPRLFRPVDADHLRAAGGEHVGDRRAGDGSLHAPERRIPVNRCRYSPRFDDDRLAADVSRTPGQEEPHRRFEAAIGAGRDPQELARAARAQLDPASTTGPGIAVPCLVSGAGTGTLTRRNAARPGRVAVSLRSGSDMKPPYPLVTLLKSKYHGAMIRSIRRVAILGGRITATLAKILREMDGPARGLISICAAGGQGITALLERLWDFRSSRPRT
jgi:hypothetical protein